MTTVALTAAALARRENCSSSARTGRTGIEVDAAVFRGALPRPRSGGRPIGSCYASLFGYNLQTERAMRSKESAANKDGSTAKPPLLTPLGGSSQLKRMLFGGFWRAE